MQRPTGSASFRVFLTSGKFFHLASPTILFHEARDASHSLCFAMAPSILSRPIIFTVESSHFEKILSSGLNTRGGSLASAYIPACPPRARTAKRGPPVL